MAHAPIRHLVLVGLMGTGKTTTGRILADRLGWPLRDSDPEIEAERFLSGTHRPWYGDDPEEFLARQAREREPEFRSLDPVIVSTDIASAEEVADAILAGIRARGIDLA
jgi:shikimate kinase